MNMTIEELTREAKKFLRETYNMELKIPIKTNYRMKNVLAWFSHYKNFKQAVHIEMSSKLLKYGSRDIILDVLKHELIHYYCYEKNLNHLDGSDDFENELKKQGISGQQAFFVGELHRLSCNKCKRVVTTSIKTRTKGSCVSHCCYSKTTYLRTDVYDGSQNYNPWEVTN